MPTRRLTISIPKPCPETWSNMMPQETGSYCVNCQKTVVDFTRMTDREVQDWLSNQKNESACGRFRKTQLERDIITVIAPNLPFRLTWHVAAFGFLAWFSIKPVVAQTSKAENVRIENRATSETFGTATQSATILKGKVVDENDKTGISGVTILLEGTTIAASTDQHGNFSLTIPDEFQVSKDQQVIFSFIGYVTQKKNLTDLLKEPELSILLSVDAETLGEVIMVGGYHAKWYSPRSLFYRVRNLFH